MTPEPGLRITATLELEREIARGGMGSVWRAEDLALHRPVAVKFMAPELADVEVAHARFELEARAAARLRSPHVARVFDYARASDATPFIVMELLEGETLDQRIQRRGVLSLPETRRVVEQVGAALVEAHGLGIVHRDIKAENVFLASPPGVPLHAKLLDFGVAKVPVPKRSGPLTVAGRTVGTVGYISPEQLLSPAEVDARSDVWSLGVVVYRCLTGSLPFEGRTFGAMLLAVDQGRFVRPSERRSGLSPAIDAWCAKALARAPSQRFASVHDMVRAFRAATPTASEVVAGARATRLRRGRAPVAVALLAVAALGLAHLEPGWATGLALRAQALGGRARSGVTPAQVSPEGRAPATGASAAEGPP